MADSRSSNAGFKAVFTATRYGADIHAITTFFLEPLPQGYQTADLPATGQCDRSPIRSSIGPR